MKTDPREPIHPTEFMKLKVEGKRNAWTNPIGLTKREYFASALLQAMLSNPQITEQTQFEPIDVIRGAIKTADALIEELNK